MGIGTVSCGAGLLVDGNSPCCSGLLVTQMDKGGFAS